MEAALRADAAHDGLEHRVHFLGVVPYSEMPLVYRSAWLWLSTSTSEVHPMAALEAIASGLPVAGIADEAPQGIVKHGVNGFAVQHVDELVGAAGALLDGPELHTRMAAASAELSRPYHVEETAARLADLYRLVHRRTRRKFAA